MKKRHSYIGILNGISGIFCDKKPKGIDLEKTIEWYSADEGMVFTKDGELYDSVILKEGESIEEFVEIKDPRNQEQAEEE